MQRSYDFFYLIYSRIREKSGEAKCIVFSFAKEIKKGGVQIRSTYVIRC